MRFTRVFLFVYFVFLFFLVDPIFAKEKVITRKVKSTSVSKPTVIVTEIKSVLLSTQLTYPARVVPEVNVAVLSEIDGVVTRVIVHLGKSVKKGNPLIDVQHNEP